MKKLLLLFSLLFCETAVATDTLPTFGIVPVLQGPVIQTTDYKFTVGKAIGYTDQKNPIILLSDGNFTYEAIVFNIGVGIYRYYWVENNEKRYLTVDTIRGRACLE